MTRRQHRGHSLPSASCAVVSINSNPSNCSRPSVPQELRSFLTDKLSLYYSHSQERLDGSSEDTTPSALREPQLAALQEDALVAGEAGSVGSYSITSYLNKDTHSHEHEVRRRRQGLPVFTLLLRSYGYARQPWEPASAVCLTCLLPCTSRLTPPAGGTESLPVRARRCILLH